MTYDWNYLFNGEEHTWQAGYDCGPVRETRSLIRDYARHLGKSLLITTCGCRIRFRAFNEGEPQPSLTPWHGPPAPSKTTDLKSEIEKTLRPIIESGGTGGPNDHVQLAKMLLLLSGASL